MKLPIVRVQMPDARDEDKGIEAEFNTSTYLTKDSANLRAKADFFISILRSHRTILDELVEQGAKAEASSIRAEEKLNTR